MHVAFTYLIKLTKCLDDDGKIIGTQTLDINEKNILISDRIQTNGQTSLATSTLCQHLSASNFRGTSVMSPTGSPVKSKQNMFSAILHATIQL